jgi:dTDP-4-dehydrorhamnose reductase
MKCVVLGNGFLGSEFKRNGKYTVLDRNEFQIGNELNILDPYDVIINCIGISDTRYCETQKGFEDAMIVNGIFPGVLSKYCQSTGKKFVHISTGCLYDESYRSCTEKDFTVCHCGYTVTKYAGEKGCNLNRDIILRPRLLFNGHKSKNNNLLCKLPKFTSFVDEFNSITSTVTIVEATESLLLADASGIFNVANAGVYTIYDFAKLIGCDGNKLSGNELRKQQGLYLVNNVMDITKLSQYYKPRNALVEVDFAYKQLKNNE